MRVHTRSVNEAVEEEDYIILSKESDDPDEAFLEYHYTDELQAQSTFFSSKLPMAFLKKENGKWVIHSVTEECIPYKDILLEQVSLLNGES